MRFYKLKLLTLWSTLTATHIFAANEQIYVGVGEKTEIKLEDLAKSVDIEEAKIVSVDRGTDKTELVVKGRIEGQTRIGVVLRNGSSHTYQVNVVTGINTLKRRLSALPGLSVEVKNGRLVISGSVRSREVEATLAQVKNSHGSLIIDATDSVIKESGPVVKTINKILAENGLGHFASRSVGKMIFLEGSPKDKREAELALRVARTVYSQIEDHISYGHNGGPAISIEVLFIEASNDNDRTIGFPRGLGASVGSPSQPGGLAGANIQAHAGTMRQGNLVVDWQIGGLTTFLKMIQTTKSSRVLSNPRLVARSGQEAKFHAGETRYLSKTEYQKEVMVTTFVPVDVGIELSILPKIDGIGQIDSKIKTSVSEFLTENMNAASANMSISKVDTAVTIQDGQTIILSGLVRKRDKKEVDRVPVLADIPLIGELFKSRKTVHQDGELLVLVTMNKVKGADETAKFQGKNLFDRAAQDVELSFFD